MKPTTPLPWKQADGHFQHVTGDDLAYIIHAANAYPELVRALQLILRTDRVTNTVEFREQLSVALNHTRTLLKLLGERVP